MPNHQDIETKLESLGEELAQVDRVFESGGSTEQAISRWLAIFGKLCAESSACLDANRGIPIRRGEQVFGHLKVEGPSPDPVIMSLLVREGVHLLERAHRECRKVEELGRLNRSGALIQSRLGLDATLQTILQMALEVTGARHGIFRLLSESGDDLLTAAVAGEQMDRPLVEALPVKGAHITGWVVENRRSIRIDDLHQEPWSTLYFPLDQLLEMRSELAVPLLGANGRFEGVLNLESPAINAFSLEDQILLETFAGQAVVAIQQVRLLDALQEIAECVLAWPCKRVLQRIVELSVILIDARGVRLTHPRGELAQGKTSGPHLSVRLENLGELTAYIDKPGEWEGKVLGCLAHHAVLALNNEQRLEELTLSQQRQAVTEAFAAVGDMSANLLHQLNNKVGIIPVRIEGIRDKCSDFVTQSEYLDRNLREIESSAQNALEVVQKNMSVLRPRPTGAVNLVQCVERAIKELNFQVEVKFGFTAPTVEGDFRSLTLVFINLLENAARAMDGAGEIHISAHQPTDSKLIVSIRDQGPGIAPERQQEVFKLSSDRSRPHNLGFGLWWVKTVMQRMGGDIRLDSDGHDGTTFHLEFPVCE